MSVRGTMVGEATTGKGSSQEEAPTAKEGLGRTAFVGGIAPGTSSGTLQRHLQQFAQVKYCALLSGTSNDKARAAKVTFLTREERIKAFVADDSVLRGRALRVRPWESRPRAKPEHTGTRLRVGSEQAHSILAPPGLESYTPSTDEDEGAEGGGVTVRMATTGIMVPALKPVGELCAVLHTIQGEDEPTRDKAEDKEDEPTRDKAEDKEGERNANEGKEEELKEAELKGSARRKGKEEGDRG